MKLKPKQKLTKKNCKKGQAQGKKKQTKHEHTIKKNSKSLV